MSQAINPADRVPLPAKITYGAASMVDGWCNYVPKSMSNQVFNMTLGVSPSLISLAFLIFRLWDAFIDPLMGWVSDQTRSRWGRRRPYLVVGGILVAVTFPLIWLVPRTFSHGAMAAWLIISGLVFYTCFTVWAMPYQGLLLELTPDYHERTRVTAVRAFFGKIGALFMGWIWAITQLPIFANPATGKPDTLTGIRTVAFALALVILVLSILPVFFVKERYYDQATKSRKKEGLRRGLAVTFKNRPFVILILSTLLFSVGTNMTAGFGVYVNTYYVQAGNQQAASIWTGWVNTTSLGLGILSLPLFSSLAKRIGKDKMLLLCMGILGLSSVMTWWTYTPAHPWMILLNAVMNTPAMTGMWLAIPSMTADVVDQDELDTGGRREGTYASVYSWIIKAGAALGYGISGPLLDLTGFHIELASAQTPQALFNMRVANAVIPAIAMWSAIFIMMRYPLSASRMQTIRAELETRRGPV